MSTLILASSSAYKKTLLERLYLAFDTREPGIDESPQPGEAPADLAARLARSKADAVAASTSGASPALIIGADQVPALGHRILHKPGDHATALQQLAACQGKTVVFHTAVSVFDMEANRHLETVDDTEVDFAQLSSRQLDRYLQIEQPYDCAGGFKAEGLGIGLFEAIRSSDPTALIGLPLIWLAGALRKAGHDPLVSAPDSGDGGEQK